MLITTGIFSGSYVLRTILNFFALFDGQALVNLQVNSCENGTDGWAMLVFCLHFFGEVLPLSLLFCMQISIYRDKFLKFSRESEKAIDKSLDSDRLLRETTGETTRQTEGLRVTYKDAQSCMSSENILTLIDSQSPDSPLDEATSPNRDGLTQSLERLRRQQVEEPVEI